MNRKAMFAQAARGPVLLIVIGTLFALQQAGVIPVSRTWPLLIIVVGVMKLFERVPGGAPMYAPRSSAEPPGGTRL